LTLSLASAGCGRNANAATKPMAERAFLPIMRIPLRCPADAIEA
jgi:hypothetical protein